MLATIKRFESDGFIESEMVDVVRQAEVSGTYRHTIGYELELLPSAGSETPRLVDEEIEGKEIKYEAFKALYKYDYEVASDGVYELLSPPSRHPTTLALATRGIIRTGWLPETPNGVVTAHVSIGSSKDIRGPDQQNRLINLLRAVEMADGTTPGRLYSPIRQAKAMGPNVDADNFSWAIRGIAGVMKDIRLDDEDWRGRNNRIEFRTIRYQSPDQFGTTLEALYFLTRGLLSGQKRPAHAIYAQFEEWFKKYQQAYGLPDIADCSLALDDKRVSIEALSEYLVPYIYHLGNENRSALKSQVGQTVGQLAAAFNMPRVPAH
jgi:hypothetical protein